MFKRGYVRDHIDDKVGSLNGISFEEKDFLRQNTVLLKSKLSDAFSLIHFDAYPNEEDTSDFLSNVKKLELQKRFNFMESIVTPHERIKFMNVDYMRRISIFKKLHKCSPEIMDEILELYQERDLYCSR